MIINIPASRDSLVIFNAGFSLFLKKERKILRNKQPGLRVTPLGNKDDGKELDDTYEFSKRRDEKETVITLTRLSG